MTRRISLIAVAAIAALALTTSAALGQSPPLKPGLSDFGLSYGQKPQSAPEPLKPGLSDFGLSFNSTPLPTAPVALGRHDSVESAIAARDRAVVAAVPDVVDRAVTARQRNLPIVHRYSDSAEGAIAAADLPTAQPTSSGTEIEWPQIGIGFGVGIFLMLTLWLGFRATRARQLAHS